jgi:uncharacterized protein YodC (DUF2158 family)
MADSGFKKGDVVQLKSGGPKMTITNPRQTDGTVFCEWFDKDGDRQNGAFEPESLVKVG